MTRDVIYQLSRNTKKKSSKKRSILVDFILKTYQKPSLICVLYPFYYIYMSILNRFR